MKACPHCGKQIQDAAIFCRHCRRDTPGVAVAIPTASKAMFPLAKAAIALVSLIVLFSVGALINGGFETYQGEREAQARLRALGVNDAAPSETLQLLSSRDTSEYGYRIVEGEVKNVSGHAIAGLEVVVSWYDTNDQLVKSDDALIEYNPILDGQTSPFKSMTTSNPAIRSYRVGFKTLGGGTVPYTEIGHQSYDKPR